MEPSSVSALEGRWVASEEGGAEKHMVVISKEGSVSFVGEKTDDWMLAVDESKSSKSGFFLLAEGSEKLASLRRDESAEGPEVLIVTAVDGRVERWQRLGDGETTPQVVVTRSTVRRWTKEGQATKTPGEVVLPSFAGREIAEMPITLEGLAGRWLAMKDGKKEGMIILSDEGKVTFVGEPGSDELFVVEDEDSRPDFFAMCEGGERLADLRFERPADGAAELLHVTGKDGGSETWHRVGGGGTPLSPSRVPARDLRRRWTKQGQAARPETDADQEGPEIVRIPTSEKGFGLHVELKELAGRWAAVVDGEEAGMILIEEGGGVTFVGDLSESAPQIAADAFKPGSFSMSEGEDEKREHMASLEFQRLPSGEELLHVETETGKEVWRRLGPASPKVDPESA